MRFLSKSIFFCFLILNGSLLFAQKGSTTLGIQVKPIFPFNFLNTGPLFNDTANVNFRTELTSGFSGGLIIRHAFSDLISLETGINYVKRNIVSPLQIPILHSKANRRTELLAMKFLYLQ